MRVFCSIEENSPQQAEILPEHVVRDVRLICDNGRQHTRFTHEGAGLRIAILGLLLADVEGVSAELSPLDVRMYCEEPCLARGAGLITGKLLLGRNPEHRHLQETVWTFSHEIYDFVYSLHAENREDPAAWQRLCLDIWNNYKSRRVHTYA